MTIKILDPTIAPDHTESTLAKRVGDLDGKVLGLLSNSKVNGDRLLDLMRERLAARYQIKRVVTMMKSSASRVADEAMLDALVRCRGHRHRRLRVVQHVQFARRDRAGSAGRPHGRHLHRAVCVRRQGAGGDLREPALSVRGGRPPHREPDQA